MERNARPHPTPSSVADSGLLIPRFGMGKARKFDEPDSPGGGPRPTGVPVPVGPVPSPGVSLIFPGSGVLRLLPRVDLLPLRERILPTLNFGLLTPESHKETAFRGLDLNLDRFPDCSRPGFRPANRATSWIWVQPCKTHATPRECKAVNMKMTAFLSMFLASTGESAGATKTSKEDIYDHEMFGEALS